MRTAHARWWWPSLGLLVVLGALLASAAWAQPAPSTQPTLVAPRPPAVRVAPSTPAASSSAAASPPSFDVRLHEKVVFTLHGPRAGQSAQERARTASRALDSELDDPDLPLSHVEEEAGTAVVFVGKTPVVTLGDDDAAAAGGDITLHVYAATVSSKIDDSLRAERKRSAIATSV
ncbi:MAG TPA: hypothetical protein VIY73_04660, partial [Polyangiaceae bacterium]